MSTEAQIEAAATVLFELTPLALSRCRELARVSLEAAIDARFDEDLGMEAVTLWCLMRATPGSPEPSAKHLFVKLHEAVCP